MDKLEQQVLDQVAEFTSDGPISIIECYTREGSTWQVRVYLGVSTVLGATSFEWLCV